MHLSALWDFLLSRLDQSAGQLSKLRGCGSPISPLLIILAKECKLTPFLLCCWAQRRPTIKFTQLRMCPGEFCAALAGFYEPAASHTQSAKPLDSLHRSIRWKTVSWGATGGEQCSILKQWWSAMPGPVTRGQCYSNAGETVKRDWWWWCSLVM